VVSAKPRLYLHVGAGKTGSSAIQQTLGDNSARLARLGFLVPDNQLGTGLLIDGAQALFFDGLLPIDDRKIDDVSRRLEHLRRHVVRRGGGAVVVSAENLLNSGQFARLFVAARDWFDIEVIAYIRRQDDFLIAMWNQWHFKSSPDFRAWSESVKGRIGNWDQAIGAWERELEGVTYTVRVHDRQRLLTGDVVADFLSVIGLASDDLVGGHETAINRSLNEVAMRVAVRNRGHFTDVHDRRFTDFLRQLGGPGLYEPVNTGLYWDAGARRAIVDLYAESNERLRQRHFPELAAGGLFSTEFGDAGLVLSETERIERELDLAWTVMFNGYVAHWPRVSLYLLRRLASIDRWFDRRRIARRSR